VTRRREKRKHVKTQSAPEKYGKKPAGYSRRLLFYQVARRPHMVCVRNDTGQPVSYAILGVKATAQASVCVRKDTGGLVSYAIPEDNATAQASACVRNDTGRSVSYAIPGVNATAQALACVRNDTGRSVSYARRPRCSKRDGVLACKRDKARAVYGIRAKMQLQSGHNESVAQIGKHEPLVFDCDK
jgi:hypothetical protein